jgi:hypothetical protein
MAEHIVALNVRDCKEVDRAIQLHRDGLLTFDKIRVVQFLNMNAEQQEYFINNTSYEYTDKFSTMNNPLQLFRKVANMSMKHAFKILNAATMVPVGHKDYAEVLLDCLDTDNPEDCAYAYLILAVYNLTDLWTLEVPSFWSYTDLFVEAISTDNSLIAMALLKHSTHMHINLNIEDADVEGSTNEYLIPGIVAYEGVTVTNVNGSQYIWTCGRWYVHKSEFGYLLNHIDRLQYTDAVAQLPPNLLKAALVLTKKGIRTKAATS